MVPTTVVDILREAWNSERPAFTFLDAGCREVESVSRHELCAAAYSIAAGLKGRLAAGSRVLICMQPGLHYIEAYLGIVAAGMTAVPLFPPKGAQKEELVRAVVRDCSPSMAIVDDGASIPDCLDGMSPTNFPKLLGDTAGMDLFECDAAAVAHLQYTSGSTGNPKGVAISHRNLLANLTALKEELLRDSGDEVFVNWAPPYHDFGLVVTILFPLFLGCHSVIFSAAHFVARPRLWLEAITKYRGTICGAPNFAYEYCVARAGDDLAGLSLETWRIAINAAEPVDARTLQRFTAAFHEIGFRDHAHYPCYGLAEATVFLAGGRPQTQPTIRYFDADSLRQGSAIDAEESGAGVALVGCGFAKRGHVIRIVGKDGEALPDRQIGEIWAAGPSIAGGYWGATDKSRETFGASLRERDDVHFLRTGDLGFFLDGQLFITGRKKDILIVHGRNYSPQDIERVVEASHPRLVRASAAAFAIGSTGVPGDRLGITVEVQRGRANQDFSEVFAAIRAAVAVQCELLVDGIALLRQGATPKTTSGKIRRSKIAADFASGNLNELERQTGNVSRAYSAPQAGVEQRLAAIWSQVLELGTIGRDDNFFLLGGDSLKAMRVLALVETEFETTMSLREIFATDSLRECAAAIESGTKAAGGPSAIPRRSADVAPLSFGQERLAFLDRMGDAGAAYHIAGAVRMVGELDERALHAALDTIVQRHEALRTRIARSDGGAVQIVEPAVPFAIRQVDLRQASDQERDELVLRQTREEVDTRFDLSRGPLIRGRLLRVRDQEHVLVIAMHHIVSDGWSIGILIRELGLLYSAYRRAEASPLRALPIQYADYALWQRRWLSGDVLHRQLEYWKQHLGEAPALLTLPLDRARPAFQSYRGDRVDFELDAELTAALRNASREYDATPFMLLYASYALLLSKLSGQSDIVIGSPVANRQRAEVEDLIGFFVNTLALRTKLDASVTVAGLVAQIKKQVLAGFDHQSIPFEQLVEALQPQRSLSHSPIFQAMVTMQNMPYGELQLPGLVLTPLELASRQVQCDLVLSLVEERGRLRCGFIYSTDLFDRSTIVRWSEFFERIVRLVAAHSGARIGAIDLLGDAEREQIVRAFNETRRECSEDRLIHELFEEQVERTPHAVALEFEGTLLTYSELNSRANRLAGYLRAQGVRADDLVGLRVERSLEMVVGLLGILKSGAGYLPLDPAYPPERLEYMLKDARVRVVLSQAPLERSLPLAVPCVLLLDTQWEQLARFDAMNLPRDASAERTHHLAYVIYTSGSTGRPKGVMVEHRNVVNHCRYSMSEHRFSPADRVMQFASIAFDASAEEIFPTLSSGATLVLRTVPLSDTATFSAFVQAQRITVLDLPTAFWATWSASLHAGWLATTSLRLVIIGGERVAATAVAEWLSRDPAGIELINTYGPTEATIISLAYRIAPAAPLPDNIPIGRPIWNTQIYILDDAMRPVPVGVTGEIYIGGAGVARGYLNQLELTAQRFVGDSFSKQRGGRLYRTGDLARWRADGIVEYLGRNDQQVKIRGFRIEPGEIETQLRRHASVREAVVLAREDEPGQKRLVAYVTNVAAAAAAVAVDELRDQLRKELPEYMLPAAYVVLESLPLTVNGKVDRGALPPPDEAALGQRDCEAPQGEMEQMLARLWSEFLRVDRIGRHDDFFELGGHSLLAVQLVDRLRKEGYDAEVRSIFSHSTLCTFATTLKISTGRAADPILPSGIPEGANAITPEMLPLVELRQEEIEQIAGSVPGGAANIQDIYPLAPLQEGILFHHLVSDGRDAYVGSALLEFSSPDQLDRLLEGIQRVMDRHEILRTSFHWVGFSQPVQVVQRSARLVADVHELAHDQDAVSALTARMSPDGGRMNVRCAPLIRVVKCFDPGNRRWLALIQQHHLVSDHVSNEIILEEVLRGNERAAGELQGEYKRYVQQALLPARRSLAEQYFTRQLSDVTEGTIPFGLTDVHGDGAQIVERKSRLCATLAARIRLRAARAGVSPAAILHAAFALVIARCSGREDVVFGTVLAGRSGNIANASRTVGVFINTLPLRIRLGTADAGIVVAAVHEELAALLAHDDASLVQALRCSGIPSGAPLFTSVLNYRHSGAHRAHSGDPPFRLLAAHERSNYPLTLSIDDDGNGFTLTLLADPAINATYLSDYFVSALESLVDALESGTRCAAVDLQIGSAQELALRDAANATQDEKFDECLTAAFLRSTRQSPDAVAVYQDERRVSYAELLNGSRALQASLERAGCKPGDLVAVVMHKGWEQVVAVLAIHFAGAAYVPIDPGWPLQRRNELMAKSGTTFAVVSAGARESLEFPASIGVVSFTEEMLREITVNSPLIQRSPDDLAYVIFTSGSTGVPKGVAISHRAAVNTVLHVNRMFSVTAADKVLAVSQLHFDLSVYDIFGLLAVGGALVFPEPALANDPGHWVDLVNRHGVTIWDSVPQLLDLLLDANRGAGNLKSLRVAMLSGDWIPLGLPDRLRDLVPTAQFFSLGGATEGSIWSIYFPVGRIDPRWESIPYGTALPNQHMYVLNERHQPCPELVEGDIYIGGDGVALGYWKDEALTQRQFMHSAVTGERIYKTGDMGRWRPDGNIQFLGRRDQQVKIRGFRVELGEIEACLRVQESVREAIVVTRDDAGVGKLLIAYVIPAGADFSLEACRAQVAERLPQYMLPHAFVVLDSVPLTANGKLDRKALPLPQLDRAGPTLGAVQSETEAALAETWKKVLHVRNVNREDNFFELGGHSLLAMQVVLAIRERWSVPMPIQALFAAENLAALAARIDDAVNDRDRYRAVRADGKAAQDQQPMDEILL